MDRFSLSRALAPAILLLAAACGRPEAGPAVETAPAPLAEASGFITANAPPPPGAEDTRGDGVFRDQAGRPFGYALLGEPLPSLALTLSDGRGFNPGEPGRWTVIDVWGAWCGDCIADGPYVTALDRAIAQDPDLDFVSIHVPASAARATPEDMFGRFGSLEAYFETAGYELPTVIDTDGRLREALRISWTPSYLLVSPNGVVRGFRTDLSAASGEPVKDFLQDVARVKAGLREADAGAAVFCGALGLEGPAPFTLRAVEAAFPGHIVTPSGADDDLVFDVRQAAGDAPRFRVHPDWTRAFVSRITTRAGNVTGPYGETPGQWTLGDTRSLGSLTCSEAEEAVICATSGQRPRLIHVFEGGAGDTNRLAELVYEPALPDLSP